MKTLTLLRHAKSSWDDAVPRDFDRPLNAKGMRAARTMGQHMRETGLEFDQVIASPAARVVDTLDGVWEGYGKTLTPSWDRRVYLASAVTLLDVVHDAPDSAGRVLLVGHNSGLEDLALMLVPDRGDGGLRDDLETKFPTGSLVEMQIDVAHWVDVKPGSARLTRFVRPRDLDPELGPDKA